MKASRPVLAATILAATLQLGGVAQQPTPQYRIPPVSDLTGVPGLSLALRKLTTVGTLMQITAHPDDEPNTVLALYARHFGMRVALVTATRGDGGQNEIGPELFDALGILRTEELNAAHKFDGAEQYFTRAVDFGYSFSPQETFEKWGHDEILGDMVRHIRAIRPDVIMSMSPEGMGGGQHHQASAMLAAEAFRAAADPARFPEQIRDGLRSWQPQKLYRSAGFGAGRGGRGAAPGGAGQRGAGRGAPPAPPATDGQFATLNTGVYEPLLGCTIAEIGGVASGMHICQGRAPMVPPPGPATARLRLADAVQRSARTGDETSLFDGLDVSLGGLARYGGERPPAALTTALTEIALRAESATRVVESRGGAAALPDLAAGLRVVRDLIGQLGSMGLSDDAKYEISLRLRQKEEQFEDAIVLAHGLRIDALATDGVVVAGQAVDVTVVIGNRASSELGVRSVMLSGFDGDGGCAPGTATAAAPYECRAQVRVPRDAKLTNVYWDRPENAGRATVDPDAPFGLPFRPTPLRARVELDAAGARITHDLPVQFRYEGAAQIGEKRMELQVVPAFAVSVSPAVAVVPIGLPLEPPRLPRLRHPSRETRPPGRGSARDGDQRKQGGASQRYV